MNPVDFLDVAGEWAAGNREAEWRSAASRAYYAAFHVARKLLHQAGFVVPQAEQAHAYLWLRLANAGHPDVERAGNDLIYLRRVRNAADYDLDRPFAQLAALDHVQLATDAAKLLETVVTTPTVLARITDTIKAYERDVLGQVTWQP
jgi:uncharacterized protein (UPF0332 family)